MADTLLIRLPVARAAQDAQWLLVDPAGGRLGAVLQGSLADAAPLAAGRKIVVLVPGTEVVCTDATLPLRRTSQLDQLARYALEDHLASDIDDLHFAIGKRGAGGVTPVAIVEHDHMQAWISQLQDVGIVADAIYSENDLVPLTPGGHTLILDQGILWTRSGTARATALDVQPLTEVLGLALANMGESAGDAIAYIAQADYERDGATIEGCREKLPGLQIKLLPEGALPLFALQVANNTGVNMLSGAYARKKSWDKTLAPWRIAAALCGVALGLYIATTGVRYWQLTRVERQLDQQIRELVAQTLPNAPSKDPRNARRQFEAALQATRGGGESGVLLRGLDVITSTVEQVPDARIDQLAFRAQTIDLRITAPTVDALDRIQHLAVEQGFNAEIQSAQPRENKVEGRLQLKTPGA